MPTATELRELEDEELEGRLAEYRRELLNLRFQIATGQLDNVTRLSVVRRDVARVLTILRDREIALAEGRPAGPVISTRPVRRRPAEADVEDGDEPRATPARARRTRAVAADEVADEDAEELTGGVDTLEDTVATEDTVPADGDGDEEDE